MTDSTRRRCRWCGAAFVLAGGPGRKRWYCRRSHRQRAYEARRLAETHHLGPDDVLVAKETWEGIADRRYRLEAAVEDVVADLAADPGDLRAAFDHLLEAARDLIAFPLEPKALGDERP